LRCLRAPLLHFVAGGTAVFCLVHAWGRFAAGPPPRSSAPVVVTAGDIDRLRVDYVRETGLEPTAADEAALVDKAIDEELLFREAVARGLDRNDRSVRNWLVEQMKVLADHATDDPDRLYADARALGLDRTDLVVRRILVQKMRLLAARGAEAAPSDAELAAFYAAHRADYRPPDRVTLWHVFLASSRHEAAEPDALLARLRREATGPEAAVRRGDAFVAPPHLVAQSPTQLERLFGPAFVAAVERGATGAWIGPVASPYGSHLVWIEAREAGAPPPLDAVRTQVVQRWQDERRARGVATLVADLRRRHPLRVESTAWQQRGAS